MREYGKVFSRIWESADFRRLSEDGQKLALYLLTCQHGTIAGVFRVPDGYAAEDLQWPPERVAQGFRELFENGFANRCETTKWVWVTKFLEWNQLENPNQRKAAARIAQSIPDSCAWKRAFMRACGQLVGLEAPGEPNPSGTLPEPLPNQEQEQEKEKPSALSAAPTLPACPFDSVVGLYHEHLPMLPAVRLMPDKRRTSIRKLWTWVLTSRKRDGSRRATTADEALAWIAGYFAQAAENDFLTGKLPQRGAHANWRCDLDFLLTDRGMTHVIERTLEAA